mmetsp:Transcript_22888/g.49501  ORF Transcript_22888/g.49501 Transcript_22888/m.49501 type:complete len:208 (-) Transcript_22888:66-689(-)
MPLLFLCILCFIGSSFSFVPPGQITIKTIRNQSSSSIARMSSSGTTTSTTTTTTNPDPMSLFQTTPVLTSAAAQLALSAAEQCASTHGYKVTIAISDPGGTPLLVKRTDGAFPASYEIAVGKAKTAALFRKATGALEDSANVVEGRSRAALLSAPFVLMRGGVPIVVEGDGGGVCIGAVGVSGVTPEEDEQVAMAAVNALGPAISKL